MFQVIGTFPSMTTRIYSSFLHPDKLHRNLAGSFQVHGSVHRCNNLNKDANQIYFVLKSLKFIYIIPLYMFRTPLCPSSEVTTQQDWRTQRTKHHMGPETACAAEKLLMMDTMVSETCRAE